MSTKRINFLGDIFCDVVASNVRDISHWGGDTKAAISFLPGGSCLNAICHAEALRSYLGLSTEISIFSAVGDDLQGKICLEKLESIGISIKDVIIYPNLHTPTCIVFSGDGERSFITDSGTCEMMTCNDFNQENIFRCDHLHVAEFYSCVGLMPSLLSVLKEVSFL